MYLFLIFATMLKSVRPYVKKYVLHTLDSHDYLFLNTLFIGGIVSTIFIYKLIFDKKIKNTFENIKNLSILQLFYFLILAVITVYSTIIFLEFDKNHNTPLINSMITKFISTLSIICISIFIFREKYSFIQIVGVFLTILGIFITTQFKN
jgi:drug/metabolite transporter (DMT)-like permease